MVLQILTNAWKVGDRLNPELAQIGGIAYAGQLEDLRSMDSSSSDYGFFAGMDGALNSTSGVDVFDSNSRSALEDYLTYCSAWEHMVVRPGVNDPIIVVHACGRAGLRLCINSTLQAVYTCSIAGLGILGCSDTETAGSIVKVRWVRVRGDHIIEQGIPYRSLGSRMVQWSLVRGLENRVRSHPT